MRRVDLKLLMEKDWYSPMRGQVLLHALCNLKSVPYTPNLGAISAESLAPKVKELHDVCGVVNIPTASWIPSSTAIQSLATILIKRGDISEAQLDNEIGVLVRGAYSDPGYIQSMMPPVF